MSDVFISFTHNDNAKLSDEQQGWVDRLHEALQARLNQLWGRETSIWRDPKLAGNDLLTPSIEIALEKSALLLCVLSPTYLKSEWCKRELRMFYEAASRSGGLQVGNKLRIVKAIKTPVDSMFEEPALALSDCLGHAFYRANDKGVPWEFDPRRGEAARQEFLTKVNELAYDLCKTLEALMGSQESRHQVTAPTGITVYLAQSSSDLASERERLRRELEQFGHTVLPEVPLPLSPEFANRVRETLKDCRLSIHPVGNSYGVIPEGEERSIVALQYALAGEEALQRSNFVRLPWMPSGVQAADAREEAFVRELRNDSRLLITSLESLKTIVQDMLAPRPPLVSNEVPTIRGGVLSVYLIFDVIDASAAQLLENWLFEQQFDVIRPLFDGDERELREDHEENLKTCDAVLIYHGQTTEFWLRTKLRDLQKAFGYGRRRPFLARGVLLADPVTPEKLRFRSHDVLALPAGGAFAPAMLEPFLRNIDGKQGEAV